MKVFDTNLSDRTALVTGSTRGIGYASAVGLADMGATVAINGRDAAAVDSAIAMIKTRVPDAKLVGAPGDLCTAEGCDAVIAAAPEIDILVNNTGIYEPKPFEETPDADWQRMFDVNVMSGVRLTRHHLPKMLERNWGRVVFVSSESAIVVPAEMIHYGFSKAAQLAISRGCAELTKGSRVTVNSVLPGPTWVEAQVERVAARASSLGITSEQFKERTFTERRPSSLLQRYAEPEEVASLICYVCSPAAAATNGAALRCDGGIVRTPF
ncbi:SDR family oxidoreductase [Thalassobaculum sp.]|uniref:SDR family NAD(P)-dependent oxidoreductase n=1 Tax=Thalassobaculum sp. TaxID=2022740 RepID=UPI0032EE86FA